MNPPLICAVFLSMRLACRLKQLREEPYTQAEAERAAGMGSYIPAKKVEVHTQPLEEEAEEMK